MIFMTSFDKKIQSQLWEKLVVQSGGALPSLHFILLGALSEEILNYAI